ncbi:MAG: antitoxin [Acetobacteraceae bacterium]
MVYTSPEAAMPSSSTAKLFRHGRSQAVRLPKEFRMPGSEVRVRRVGRGVLLEPIEPDLDAWWARLDSYQDEPFMPEGRRQPPMPTQQEIFED